MKTVSVNNINFKGYINKTPTYENLLATANKKTKLLASSIEEIIATKNDSLFYTFANSTSKRNGQDFFHIALFEENIRDLGYKVVRKIIEIPGKYENVSLACAKNKDLLEKFNEFFKTKYNISQENLLYKWETLSKIYKD